MAIVSKAKYATASDEKQAPRDQPCSASQGPAEHHDTLSQDTYWAVTVRGVSAGLSRFLLTNPLVPVPVSRCANFLRIYPPVP